MGTGARERRRRRRSYRPGVRCLPAAASCLVLGLGLAGCGGSTSRSAASHTPAPASTRPATGSGAGSAPSRDAYHQLLPGSGFVGHWSGTIDQHGPGARSVSFPLQVTVNATPGPNGIGKVSYPGGCTGDISMVSAAPGPLRFGYAYRVLEDFLSGCRDGNFVDVQALGDELTWVSNRDRTTFVGTLRLAGRAPPSPAAVLSLAGAAVAGRWAGTARQYGPGTQRQNFTVVMGMRAVGPGPQKPGWNGFVRYPSDGCRSHLFLAGVAGDSLRYQEDLLPGGGCVAGGRLDVRPFGDKLLWRWSGSYRGSPIDSWAVLDRTNRDPYAINDVGAERP